MNPIYDVAILGCGEAGIFAAYELAHHRPGLKVLALDQGRDIYHRSCPIVAGKVRECIHCSVCDTMCGFGGAGAFSDGKFNFTTQFGGWLTDFMDPRQVMELIDYVDSINVAHGATQEVFSTESAEAKALARKALGFDLHLLQARCKHLGTENNLRILQNIYEAEGQAGVPFQHRRSPHCPGRGGRLPPHPGQRRGGGLQATHRRPRPLRRRVVLRAVQGPGAGAPEQPGGHRRAGGAARLRL